MGERKPDSEYLHNFVSGKLVNCYAKHVRKNVLKVILNLCVTLTFDRMIQIVCFERFLFFFIPCDAVAQVGNGCFV